MVSRQDKNRMARLKKDIARYENLVVDPTKDSFDRPLYTLQWWLDHFHEELEKIQARWER